MLLRIMLATCAFLGVFLTQTAGLADFSSELIARGKRATALVIQKSGRVFGSAFCIDEAGLFVTNAHVVGGREDEETTLVINSGQRDEKLIRARVLRIDAERDLALLQAHDPEGLTSLALGKDDDLFETKRVAAFGYPFGIALAGRGKHPSISVNVGRITALRREEDVLQRIQFDAQVNPGNSGGPLLDEEGNVLGVVESGIVKSGVYMAIPVSQVRDWLREPVILVEPREIDFARRCEEVEFTIRVATVGQSLRPKRVEFSLGEDDRSRRTQEARAGDDGAYVVKMQPSPPPAPDRSVHVSARLKDGYIRGYTSNAKLKIGEREIELSDIRRMERDGEQWRIATSQDDEFTADAAPQVKIAIALDDEVTTTIELSRVYQLIVYPPSPATRLSYRVAVSFTDAETAVHRGEIPLVGAEAAAASALVPLPEESPDPAPPEAAATAVTERVEFKFPRKYTNFCVAAHGRYLIFQLAERSTALVFDVTVGRVVQELEGITSADLLAASADKLFVVSPGKMMVQRWRLEDFQREKVARIEGADAPVAAFCGPASDGPLLLRGKSAQLLDADSLRPLAPQERVIGGGGPHGYTMHVSADGRTFSGIPNGYGPVNYDVMQLRRGRRLFASYGSTSNAIRWSQPTADGTLLLLPGGGVFNGNGRQVQAKWLDGGALVATLHPAYFLDLRLAAEQPDGKKATRLTVCTVADCRPLYTEWGYEELTPSRINSWHDIVGALRIGHELRVQYAPWTKTMITLPAGNERIILRPFDLEAKLKATDQEYLYLLSTPPLEALKGEAMLYPLQVRTSGGAVSFALEDGPPGAVVSDEGVVSWDAPAEYSEPWARFIVSIRNDSGQDTFHSFEVAVRDAVQEFNRAE
ncbi:MAG: serine protease [Planctomycetes bacterium]|nr:serine protease [Planctomycetota bacterium]